MPPNDELTPERIAELRAMTPEQKFKEANRLYWEARGNKRDEIRSQHPEWSEGQVEKEVERIYLEMTVRHAIEERMIVVRLRGRSAFSP